MGKLPGQMVSEMFIIMSNYNASSQSVWETITVCPWNNLIKLRHYDETRKRAHDSQIARSKVNQVQLEWAQPKISIRHQPTDLLKLYVRTVIEPKAWSTDSSFIVRMKRKINLIHE